MSDAVFGVVSDAPAYLMNSEAGNNDTHPQIALKGRVPGQAERARDRRVTVWYQPDHGEAT